MATNPQSVTAKLTSKGQVTVPLAVRKALGVKTGDKLTFKRAKNGDWVIPAHVESPFAAWRGIGTGYDIEEDGIEGIVNFVRKMRGHDDLD